MINYSVSFGFGVEDLGLNYSGRILVSYLVFFCVYNIEFRWLMCGFNEIIDVEAFCSRKV